MGKEARRNAEEILLWRVEQRIGGLPVCACPAGWFHPTVRVEARTTDSAKFIHSVNCPVGKMHRERAEMRAREEELDGE